MDSVSSRIRAAMSLENSVPVSAAPGQATVHLDSSQPVNHQPRALSPPVSTRPCRKEPALPLQHQPETSRYNLETLRSAESLKNGKSPDAGCHRRTDVLRSPVAAPWPSGNVPPRKLRHFRSAGYTLTAIAGMFLAAIGGSLAEGDSDAATADEGQPAKPQNRLSRETSPYLLSHAHNPVDWYPWGPEALEKARKEDKPIFLSVGYSSCHWCHVMEKKVFSDPEIARYMNEHFVNIKVDREERPDLDDIYMTALQQYYVAIRVPQSGGWPLSLFLTPNALPIGGGTYFPPADDNGRLGFPTLMKRVVESWRDKRNDMEKNAGILADAVRALAKPRMNPQPVKLEHQAIDPVLKSL